MRLRMVVIVVGALLAGLGGAAYAQTPVRGDRAIFGGGVGDAEQLVSFRSTIGATYNDPVNTTPFVPGSSNRVTQQTWFGQGSGMLAYQYDRPFLNARAMGGAFSYYHPDLDRELSHQYLADAAASTGHTFTLSPRSSFSVGEAVSFRPLYLGGGVPGSFSGSGGGISDPSTYLPPEIAVIAGQELVSSSTAALRYDASQRVSFETGYAFERLWTFDAERDFDHWSHRVNATMRFSLTRYLRLRAGYRFSQTRVDTRDTPAYRENLADFGLEYARGGTLRLSRQTTLSFDGGLAGFVDSRRQQHYFLLGHALINHDMGRTWQASAEYRRNLDFSSLFLEPVLSDTATARLSGLISRSLQFRAEAGYSVGAVGFTTVDNGLTRVAVLAELQTALNRYLALGTNYTYYRHEVGAAVVVQPDFRGRIEGQSVRVFLSAWAPLFHRTRRT